MGNGNDLRHADRHLRRRARIEWLTRHADLWNDDRPLSMERRKMLVTGMKNAGVVARKTYWKDVRLDTETSEARSQIHYQELANAHNQTQAADRNKESETQEKG